MEIRLSVVFEDPFWIGVFEEITKKEYRVKKVVFGSEPKDYDIYTVILKDFSKMTFSKPINNDGARVHKRINPKRMQRQIKKEISKTEVGTKAQRALKLQHELSKEVHKTKVKEKKHDLKQLKYDKKKMKKKAKKRGH